MESFERGEYCFNVTDGHLSKSDTILRGRGRTDGVEDRHGERLGGGAAYHGGGEEPDSGGPRRAVLLHRDRPVGPHRGKSVGASPPADSVGGRAPGTGMTAKPVSRSGHLASRSGKGPRPSHVSNVHVHVTTFPYGGGGIIQHSDCSIKKGILGGTRFCQ